MSHLWDSGQSLGPKDQEPGWLCPLPACVLHTRISCSEPQAAASPPSSRSCFPHSLLIHSWPRSQQEHSVTGFSLPLQPIPRVKQRGASYDILGPPTSWHYSSTLLIAKASGGSHRCRKEAQMPASREKEAFGEAPCPSHPPSHSPVTPP